ncbi:Uncharacterised protein [Mycobacterium tuberculosis]|nr:Uncharacterised protein [Mycobacterium tuberculosis]
MSSIPTESRTRSSGTSNCEPAVDAWVMALGCSISDSTPPSDSARMKTRVLAHRSCAARRPARIRTETMPPKPRICRAAISCPG